MAEHSKIEWTDATWNPVTGCSVVSPGCTNCYAMKLAGTRLKHHLSRAGLTIETRAGPVWNGKVRLNEAWLDQPLRWRRPRRIFVCAHGDLFHESVPDEWIDRIFAVMALAPQHTFQVLTKRAARMMNYFGNIPQPRWFEPMKAFAAHHPRPEIVHPTSRGVLLRTYDRALRNVWLGVSVEDQQRADERIYALLETPAAVRFLSCEPLLGPLDLFAELGLPPVMSPCAIDWVICGGESGPGARKMQAEWARGLRDQCAEAGVPFFFKQWGEFVPTSDVNGPYMMHVGKKAAGRLLDGKEHNDMPASSPREP